jgi:EAL and modified HD-GYP domain-containing signal transduction protein
MFTSGPPKNVHTAARERACLIPMNDSPLLFREPLVTRERATVGYDLALYSEHGERAPVGGIAALLGSGAEPSWFERIPDRFVLADCAQVESEHSPAPGGRFVLSLHHDGALENPAATVAAWKSAGFGLCLDVAKVEEWPTTVLSQATYVRVDSARQGAELEETAAKVRGLRAKKIAAGVRSHDTFQRAISAGCDLCQGYFFTQPGKSPAQPPSASYANIVNLMRLAQEDAPLHKLEELLKRDAALSFRLLRYINSVGFGLSCEIHSFRHAVTLLGYQNLHKWLALLLVTAARQNSSPALGTAAIARGRLAELLGHDLFEPHDRDNLFITGTFSLLHAILQMPLEEIAEQVTLPDAVFEALAHNAGAFGPILELVIATESLDRPGTAARAAELAMSLGLTHEALNRAQLEALAWAEGLSL